MKWYDVDWSWYCPEDTVHRPTEIAAFENIIYEAHLIKTNGLRAIFTDTEWKVLLIDMELRLRYQNATIDPATIAARISGYLPVDIWRIQQSISFVMKVREHLQLPPLPPLPIKFAKIASKLALKHAA